MEYRSLGKSGLKVSLAGLGCNNFGMRIDEKQSEAVVHRALEEGITFFDTADIYGGRGKSAKRLRRGARGRRPRRGHRPQCRAVLGRRAVQRRHFRGYAHPRRAETV